MGKRIITSNEIKSDLEIEQTLRPSYLIDYVGPVSYTHLDVYKRQALRLLL